MTLIGSIDSFDPKVDNWTLYQEQLEEFFNVNGIVDTPATEGQTESKKRVPALLSLIGKETYKTLRDLCTPALPKDKTYEELCTLLKKQFSPSTCIFRERIEFYEAQQQDNETVKEWYARIHNLAGNCEFGNELTFVLKDKFICAMKRSVIRDRLCEESPTTTLQKLVEIAQAREAALQSQSDSVNTIRRMPQTKKDTQQEGKSQTNNNEARTSKNTFQPFQRGKWNCRRCAGTHTGQQVCKYRNYTCNICKKVGHLAKACFNKNKQNLVETGVNSISFVNNSPVYCNVNISDKEIQMLVDSGACTSIISEKDFKSYWPSAKLKYNNRQLKTYSGQPIKVLGTFNACIQYKNVKCENFVFFVIDKRDGKQSMLGRDFLNKFKFELVSEFDEKNEVLSVSETNIVNEFQEVFSDGLGCFKQHTFTLKLKDQFRPIFLKPRTVPLAYKEKVETELNRLEKEGVIEPIESSEWATPLVPVMKKDGTLRLCGDYRITANKWFEEVKYPLPTLEEMFSKLNGGESFSRIDLSNAYNQLVVDEETSKILTWNTHKGLYRVKRIPFGITPASAIFQRTLEQVLQGIDRAANFMDDIIITGNSRVEHIDTLRKVFQRLKDAGLKVKLSKCTFFEEESTFLGLRVTKEGLRKDSEKVKAILDAPTPQTMTQVQSFAGMVNYYSKFVPKLAILMKPMYNLLKKNVQFRWSAECSLAFREIKAIIASDEVLTHFDPTLPIVLTTDASKDGIAAVLSHQIDTGRKKPIVFISRTLSKAESNYAVIDKEALAIYWATKKLAYYLMGNKFVIETDHKPLVSVFAMNKRISQSYSSRMQRWMLHLAGFSYDIKYIKGQENHVADMLSRHPLQTTVEEENQEESSNQLNLIVTEGIPIDSKRIGIETRRDPVLAKVLEYVTNGWPTSVKEDNMKHFTCRKTEITCEQGCLLWGYRVIIPSKLRKRLLDELHGAHLGIVKMKAIARSYFWWPKLDEDIEKVAKSCRACIMTSDDPQKAIPTPWNKATRPWQRVHIDYLGPINGKYYFLMLDAFSKWPEIYEVPNITADTTIRKLRETFCRWGIPELIVSDNGTQLVSRDCEQFLRNNGVHHVTIAPYHPASNGAAENAVKSFKRGLKTALFDKRNKNTRTDILVSRYLIHYRNAKHATTNETPAFRMLNRNIRTLFNLIKPQEERISYDTRKTPRTTKFQIGEVVAIRDYKDTNKKAWMEAKVTQTIGQKMFLCKIIGNGRVTKRHVHQMKTIIPTDTESDDKGTEKIIRKALTTSKVPAIISDKETVKETTSSTNVETRHNPTQPDPCIPNESIPETSGQHVNAESNQKSNRPIRTKKPPSRGQANEWIRY
ncbi:uncharacterized protein K02A2.6-like [Zophobas morio]|uniref:uncharacterized protein K02A2.6-like n=1 Tax=Zophobas morio TaxID=2755281 RepID=UPI0030828A3C